jgi:hypothetical protein
VPTDDGLALPSGEDGLDEAELAEAALEGLEPPSLIRRGLAGSGRRSSIGTSSTSGWGGLWALSGGLLSRYRWSMRTDRTRPKLRWNELSRRLQLAFVRDAEERSRLEHGRGLTTAELRRVVAQYPGDRSER